MARILITRSDSDNQALAARLEAVGHDVVKSSLIYIDHIDCETVSPVPDALLFTSRQAPAAAVSALKGIQDLPVFAIGPGTAAAARAAGFTTLAAVAEGSQENIVHQAATSGFSSFLFLSGEDVRGDPVRALEAYGVAVERRIVYRAELAARFTQEAEVALATGSIDWVLLFSPRTARHFVDLLWKVPGAASQSLMVGCLSSAIACMLEGRAWRKVVIAQHPSVDSLLATTTLLCDKPIS